MIKPIARNNKFFIKSVLIIAAISVLFLFGGINRTINSTIEQILSVARGELVPDTNIVIVDINKNDIDKITLPPINKNYFALLINSLTKNGVKKIGLDIVLGSRFVKQSIDDTLLAKVIKNSGRVIVSSIAGRIEKQNKNFVTDSISYPATKLLTENISTGHINFISADDIVIPLRIDLFGRTEKAFALQLSEKRGEKQNDLHVNFISSQNKFARYSLFDFFDAVENHEIYLKNKIVIVGFTGAQFLTGIETAYDDNISNAALQAFAVDNLLRNRFTNINFIFLSALVFIVSLAAFVLWQTFKFGKPIIIYPLYFVSFFIFSYVLFGLLDVRLAYSIMLLPLFFLFISDFVFWVYDKQLELTGLKKEEEILETLLFKKELELKRFENELKVASGKEALLCVKKIKSLKNEIDARHSKLNFEEIVLELLRSRNFSQSSFNEITEEIGVISGKVISEYFSGAVLKSYVENNFDEEKTAKWISTSNDEEVNKRVKTKLKLFIREIESNIKKENKNNFELLKEKFKSKYKNLPRKFHPYLDEIIRKLISGL